MIVKAPVLWRGRTRILALDVAGAYAPIARIGLARGESVRWFAWDRMSVAFVLAADLAARKVLYRPATWAGDGVGCS